MQVANTAQRQTAVIRTVASICRNDNRITVSSANISKSLESDFSS
jgi:hypothetical protein